MADARRCKYCRRTDGELEWWSSIGTNGGHVCDDETCIECAEEESAERAEEELHHADY